MNRPSSTVAVVRSNNRRGAVAEALALIAGDLGPMPPEVSILADFAATRSPWAWTHPDTLSATLDVLFSKGADQALVHSCNQQILEHSRLRLETFGRPVRFPAALDPNEPKSWHQVEIDPGDGPSVLVRVHRSSSLVSIATMKTDGISTVALGLANLLNLVHPDDRVVPRLDHPEIDHALRSAWTKVRGRACGIWDRITTRSDSNAWRRLNPSATTLIQKAERSARLLACLADRVRPVLSVVDGFRAMHREGPKHGRSIALGVVIAGVDPVAVDAVSAAIMGFDPSEIVHLKYADDRAVGRANLDTISIVGDSLESVRRRCIPHSNQRILRHSNRLMDLIPPSKRDSVVPTPHLGPVRSANPSRR